MAASVTLNANPTTISALINKLTDHDPDFRFMSLNDLLQLLNGSKADFLHHDFAVASRTVDSVIRAVDDQNGEVQNLAVRCLGPLSARIPYAVVGPMIEKLSQLELKQSLDATLPALALRAVVAALPRPVPGVVPSKAVIESFSAISRVLLPIMLGGEKGVNRPVRTHSPIPALGMLQRGKSMHPEVIDVLIEILRCYGLLLGLPEVSAIQKVLVDLIEGDRVSSPVKKRAVVAISILAVYLSDELLCDVVSRMVASLSSTSLNSITKRFYFTIIGSIARSIPARFGKHLGTLYPFLLSSLGEKELSLHYDQIYDGNANLQEFNDVQESALVATESFLASCPQESRPFTDDTIAAVLRYLKYDPNTALGGGDDDSMDTDDALKDDDEQDDEDEELGEDGGFDDEDVSWKVRRCAAKALYSLISTRSNGDLLDNGVLYGKVAPPMIKRLQEKEENVRLEIVAALALLVKKTGEGVVPAYQSVDILDLDTYTQAPTNRKRRRQSSGGGHSTTLNLLVSPTVESTTFTGPRADLAYLTPLIVKPAIKLLQSRALPTKQAILNLVDSIVLVQRGGLSEHLNDLAGPVIESINPTGTAAVSSSLTAAGGNASATPSTLRVAALRLTGDLARTHSLSLLQPHMAKIIDAIVKAVNDRFYKISSQAIRTAEEFIKAITSSRRKSSTTQFHAELGQLYDITVAKSLANDIDVEVRQRAIHALSVLLARTYSSDSAYALGPQKRAEVLSILLGRLKNETTRLAAARAIDDIAASLSSLSTLDPAWVIAVTIELAAQLRKSNRALRVSCVHALKHLILSPASKGRLDDETTKAVVSSLLPAISNTDTYLLGPALLILAALVLQNADLVVTPETLAALCELLKSHMAQIVLDPILTLVSNVGETRGGVALMSALLKDVSVSGDPSVVGKVIGALLVVSKGSAGVRVEDFVNELSSSARSSDEARICLALSILGEVAMRMGAESNLAPALFLAQFHSEPDKVSVAAAVALGRAGSGNVDQYLPVLLKTMQSGGNTQYLLILSIKEILQHINTLSSGVTKRFAANIWDHLLTATENMDNKVVCAECVGRMAILEPGTFMPKLQLLLRNASPSVRGMAVQAVRYSLPESDEAFDGVLKQVLVDMMLTIFNDQDMEIRRLAMTTLNSAAHNKPDLILPHLGQLMPYVLAETVVKKELVREVKLGPFTHMVDDGLEVRKSAYETLYALMETAFSRVNGSAFYDRIVAGLRDDHDIRSLCNLMLSKLILIDPEETTRRLDAIAHCYRAILATKLKDNAVKQDIEKQEQAIKSVLRVTLLLAEKAKSATGGAATAAAAASTAPPSADNQAWIAYWDWVSRDYEKQLRSIRDESRELQNSM